MELFNRGSQKTPVAQPFRAVGLCHARGFIRGKKPLGTDRTPVEFLRSLVEHGRKALNPLLSILGLAILVEIGSLVLNVGAQASLVLLQIFLGLCQLGLTIFQIFGS